MSTKKKLEALDRDLDQSFANVKTDVNDINNRIDGWARTHRQLNAEFHELRDELATNGVVRDLRKVEKAQAAFEKQTLAFMEHVSSEFARLDNNGVASQINNLTNEVFKDRKKVKSDTMSSLIAYFVGPEATVTVEEPTLAGKVDAIVQYLGLDLTVKPQEVTPAKVEVKKKPVAKKKGRR